MPTRNRPRVDSELAELPFVYGAARAAAADTESAGDVAAAVMAEALAARRRGEPSDRRRLVARAVRAAAATAPCAWLAPLPEREREALALARLAGLNTDEIAALTRTDARAVKRHLLDGVRALAAAPEAEPCAQGSLM